MPAVKWWRCRDLHPGPTIMRQSRYRLSPEFVSGRSQFRTTKPAQSSVWSFARAYEARHADSTLCFVAHRTLQRDVRQRGSLRREPRPSHLSWLLFFRPCFTWPGQPWPADLTERVNVEPIHPHCRALRLRSGLINNRPLSGRRPALHEGS